MNKEPTLQDYIDFFIERVCCHCYFYNSIMGVCSGEVLPIEKAILRNLEGRGCCNGIKELVEMLKVVEVEE